MNGLVNGDYDSTPLPEGATPHKTESRVSGCPGAVAGDRLVNREIRPDQKALFVGMCGLVCILYF